MTLVGKLVRVEWNSGTDYTGILKQVDDSHLFIETAAAELRSLRFLRGTWVVRATTWEDRWSGSGTEPLLTPIRWRNRPQPLVEEDGIDLF